VGLEDPNEMEVEVLVATPKPEEVDVEKVKGMLPFGRVSVSSAPGGMTAQGLCVPEIAPDCDQIMVANAAVTVFVNK
jgi:uncharacterized protein (TIGR02058 family)